MAISKKWLEKELNKLIELKIDATVRVTKAYEKLIAAQAEVKSANSYLEAVNALSEEWELQLVNYTG